MIEVVNEIEYPIYDVQGTLKGVHTRLEYSDGSKKFTWQRPDGKIGLDSQGPNLMPFYNSDILTSATDVIVCEGEKAADALTDLDYCAVGTVTGASTIPCDDVLETLRGHKVYLWPDNDEPGKNHMRRIAEQLHKLGIACYVVDVSAMAHKADAADIVVPEIVKQLIEQAKLWSPNDEGDRAHVFGAEELERLYITEAERKVVGSRSAQRLNLQWGFDTLDNLTDGLQPGLICVHSQPGVGKTSWALQVSAQVQAPVLYVTAEMSVREMLRRLVARISDQPRRSLLSASHSVEEETEFLRQALAVAPTLTFMDAAAMPAQPEWIEEQIQRLKHMDRDGHALLVIDSLHSWILPLVKDITNLSEYDAINNAVVSLRTIASKYDIPVLVICERNRAQMTEGGLSAVAGSRAPEYRSDLVLSLDSKGTQDDPTALKEINLSVLKNRHGAAGAKIQFLFDGDKQAFAEVGLI